MRLWSLHPRYLDPKGLVALWREALLAQAVLRGRTRGYRSHPQLDRFRESPAPVAFIAEYLRGVHAESVARGYRFDAGKIVVARADGLIDVTGDQMEWERRHLVRKLEVRAPAWLEGLAGRGGDRGDGWGQAASGVSGGGWGLAPFHPAWSDGSC